MPKNVIAPGSTEFHKEKYARQTKEQFEALGRFVQSFELMLDSARSALVKLIGTNQKHQRLVMIVLHNHAFSAAILMETLRAIIFEITQGGESYLSQEEKDMINEIASQINKDYEDIVKKRNEIIHCTWLIGWAGEEEQDFSELKGVKLKISKKGIKMVEIQKNIEALNELISRCEEVEHLIRCIVKCIPMPLKYCKPQFNVRANFEKNQVKWITTVKRG